jgi:hypothetical protein
MGFWSEADQSSAKTPYLDDEEKEERLLLL